jgi:hypothetical protein
MHNNLKIIIKIIILDLYIMSIIITINNLYYIFRMKDKNVFCYQIRD